jgi:hypothetical protein
MPDPGSTRKLKDDQRYGLAKHGIAGPRGQVAPVAGRSGRFGRMFPELAPADLDEVVLGKLVKAMSKATGQSDANLDLPAGYTYLAQFVDHDLTFDPNSRLQTSNDPYTLVDFRTPRLDLDSLYASGPMDQPFLYNWKEKSLAGVRMLVKEGTTETAPRFDLPRNTDGRALLGDARNDENLIISQLHTLFVRFHNRVVSYVLDCMRPQDSAAVFDSAQRLVRWHYQWLVLNDLLPRIVGRDMKDQVLSESADGTPVISRRFFRARDRPSMPVEFSGAMYRFGHSLVREDYKINDRLANVPILRPNRRDQPQLNGFRKLPKKLEIEWKHFFPLDPAVPAQRAMRIDPSLARALTKLLPDGRDLVSLNLERGRALGLPAGRDVALAMSQDPLERDELLAPPVELEGELADAVVNSTPLWYYMLCEAQARGRGKILGPVGGRIVAEVLVGLVEGDPTSYLRQNPRWKPAQVDPLLGARPIETMADLITYVEQGGAA